MRERIRKLEQSHLATVDSVLTDVRRVAAMKTDVDKDRVLDLLLNLKIVAKETNHPQAGYYAAVFQAVREKTSVDDERFKKYLLVLLGDKEHGKVLEAMSKVDKTFKSAVTSPSTAMGRQRRRPEGRLASVECYYCHGYGHYQRRCPSRRESFAPPPKRGRWDFNATNW